MKQLLGNKWVKLVLILAITIFIIAGIIVPAVTSFINENNNGIESAANELIKYPNIEKRDVDRFVKFMDKYVKTNKEKEKFETLVISHINDMGAGETSTDFEYTIFSITAQQILLETAGYKSEAINNAYNDQINKLFDEQILLIDFKQFIEALTKEPYPTQNQDEKIYDTELTYYTNPQTIFLTNYLSEYIDKSITEATSSKDTAKLLSICYKLSILSDSDDFELDDFVEKKDIDNIVKNLTADAEQIIVKEGEGGYYDGYNTDTSQSNQSDELFNIVASAIADTDVNSSSYKFKQIKYYGDLASFYAESGLAYSYEDENGKTNYNSNQNETTRKVFLKDKIINDFNTVNSSYIKYAYEEGMVNYCKGSVCFAVSDTAFVCYLDTLNFYFDYSEL